MEHFSDCPETLGYDCCTCDMYGEERCIIDAKIKQQEGKQLSFMEKFTLWFSPCPEIKRKV